MRITMWAAVMAALLAPAAGASAQAPTVQPGDQAIYPDMPPGIAPGGCSLGWLFDGSDGATYFSIVAHCGGRGNAVNTADGERLGTVAMAGRDENGDATIDVALIRVTEAMEPRVAGAMRGHENVPTGVISPLEAATGDALLFSGWGIGFNATEQTREQRPGYFTIGAELEWMAVAPTINGDSGSAVAHAASGRALGLQKGHSCYAAPYEAAASCGAYGPSIAAIERLATAGGVKLTLRLAGQPAPPKPAAQQPPSGGSPPPSPAQKPAKAKRKPSAKAACRKKANRIKSKRKRKAALRRCAKR